MKEDSWVHGYDWHAVRDWILKQSDRTDEQKVVLQKTATQIAVEYDELAEGMERLSRVTCSECTEVCCLKATVWYDIKDLLYLYYYSKKIPEKQIERRLGGACCCLTSQGCSLDRLLRPFICTWYICPTQKRELQNHHVIQQRLEKIKSLRAKLLKVHGSYPG
jgi:hypothetical protein